MISYGLDSPLILGATEIGVFASLILYGVVVLQGYTYFRRSSAQDPLWLKLFVATILALETAHTLAACSVIYFFTVTQAGLPELSKSANTYALALTPVFETLITAMVQGFFTYRIRLLSGRWIIPGVCIFLGVLRLIGGLAMSVESFNDIPLEPDYFHYQDTYGWIITSALDIGVALDVLITLSLCYYFRQMYSPYNLPHGEELIGRLIVWTIQTGLITSLTSMAVVITFATMNHNFIWVALYALLAKLYSNSLLVSLNARPRNQQIIRGSASAGVEIPSRSPSPSPFANASSTIKTWSRWDSTPTPMPSRPGTPSPAQSELVVNITRTRTRTRSTDAPPGGPVQVPVGFSAAGEELLATPPGLDTGMGEFLSVPVSLPARVASPGHSSPRHVCDRRASTGMELPVNGSMV